MAKKNVHKHLFVVQLKIEKFTDKRIYFKRAPLFFIALNISECYIIYLYIIWIAGQLYEGISTSVKPY